MSGPIEVEGPDGSIVEFPEGTPHDVMEKAMAAQFSTGASAPAVDTRPDPNSVLTDLWRSGGDNKAIISKADELGLRITDTANLDAMREYEKANPGYYNTAAPFVTGPGRGMEWKEPQSMGDRALGVLGSVVEGIGALPDLAVQGLNAVGELANPSHYTPMGTIADGVQAYLPQVNDIDPSTRFGGNMLGGVMTPGPKVEKAPVGAPAAAKAAPAVEGVTARGVIPRAADVVAAGAREGVPVLRTDIKPPSTRIGKFARTVAEHIPLAGTSGARAAQQEARIAAAKNLVEEYGGMELHEAVDGGLQKALVAASDDLAATRGAELAKQTGIKTKIINSIQGEVPAPLTIKAIDGQIAELSKLDTAAARTVIGKLNDWRTTLQSAAKTADTGLLDATGKPITRVIPPSGKGLPTIELLRKEMGDAFKGEGMAEIRSTGEAALKKIYGPMREDMGAFIEAAQGPTVRGQWKYANDKLAAMAGELKSKAFKNVLSDAETTPESISKLIFSKSPSDVERLTANLSPAGKAKVQAAIVYKAAESATDAGTGVISPQKFANALHAMRGTTGVAFSAADKGRIDGMTRLLKATQHAAESAAAPLTGVQSTPTAIGYTLGSLFGMAALPVAGSYGLLARVYESPVMRNRLLKLAQTKPGSKAEGLVLRDIAAQGAKLLPAAANDAGALPSLPGRAAAESAEPQE